jgi:hypothetical protein
VEFDGGRFDRFETPGKHLAQAVMDGKGAAVLQEDMAKLAKGTPFCAAEHFQRHVTAEPGRQRPCEISKVGLGQLVIKRLVGDGGPKEGIETAVQIGQGLDALTGTGCRQRQAQAKGRDNALTAAKLDASATGIEQGFGKHPLELVCNHGKVSVIHRELLRCFYNNMHRRSF